MYFKKSLYSKRFTNKPTIILKIMFLQYIVRKLNTVVHYLKFVKEKISLLISV
jgi:hypothetical protein